MVRRPAVSVLVTCYNLGQYLAEAVDSVFAQSWQDFEIVIVDDGSTEPETRRILRHFRRPRTTVLHTENRGLPAARNHAIAHSTGRYLCALDCDDRLHPAFFEKTIPLLEADPGLAFVSTWLEVFGTERFLWRPARCDFPALLGECVVLTASPVRREAALAVGGYDAERFTGGDEDWDLWVSLVERGFRGVIVPEVLFYYRRRAGSMYERCNRGELRTTLRRRMLDKHAEAFARHAAEVLLLRERECADLLRGNSELEMELAGVLRPAVARARLALAEGG